jgi:hypothetical protein
MKSVFAPSIGAICGSLSLAALSLAFAAPAQAITLWNWSFTGRGNQSASGTFTTADVTPTAGVTYTITGITGTYNRDFTAYTITGLDSYQNASNTFRWNGTPSSSLLSYQRGISFALANAYRNQVNLYNNRSSYAPITSTLTNFAGPDDSVASSTLSPTAVPWETDALSVVGSTILFGFGVWSKRKSAKSLEK